MGYLCFRLLFHSILMCMIWIGYSIEYGGFLYGLFASAEYSILLFHSILMCMIWIGYSGIYMVMVYVTLIFVLFVIIRSTLPRLRYCDLFMIVYGYLFPFVFISILYLSTMCVF